MNFAVATARSLSPGFRGIVLRPGDEGYDAARAVWNRRIDKHPALIARCADADDVVEAIRYARRHRLPIAVRGHGYGVAGHAVCDGGVVVDLSAMRGVRVDPAGRTVEADAGLSGSEFDRATQAYGLATTGAPVSGAGVAGFTLGGGIGWLARAHGLACDNLLSVDVVTADGALVTASPTEHDDLFWGIRGGGGNFGVVTRLRYRLHPVTTVFGGTVFYPMATAHDTLRAYRDAMLAAPDALSTRVMIMTLPPAPSIPPRLYGKSALALDVCYLGAAGDGAAALGPLRTLGTPLMDTIGPLPYLAMQELADGRAHGGLRHYWRTHYPRDLDDRLIDTIVTHGARRPSPFAQVHLHHLGGAIARVEDGATAYSYRNAAYALTVMAAWPPVVPPEQQIEWADALWTEASRFASGGACVNFLGDDGPHDGHARAAYDAATYERLVALKIHYDPTNIFHHNHNIVPPGLVLQR